MDLLFPILGRFSRRYPRATDLLIRGLAEILSRGRMGRRIRTAMEEAGVDPALTKENILYVLGLVRDFLFVRFHPDPWGVLGASVEIRGGDRLPRGEGVILLGLHKGNFPWAFARLAKEIPLNVVLRRLKEPRLEGRLEEALSLAGMKAIRPEGATLRAMDALRRGEAVLYLIDQYFLDLSRRERASGLHRALGLLSSRLGTPLVPLSLGHGEKGVVVRLLEPFDHPDEEEIALWLRGEIYNQPHLWLWWYRLGKAKEAGRWPSILRKPAGTIPRRP